MPHQPFQDELAESRRITLLLFYLAALFSESSIVYGEASLSRLMRRQARETSKRDSQESPRKLVASATSLAVWWSTWIRRCRRSKRATRITSTVESERQA